MKIVRPKNVKKEENVTIGKVISDAEKLKKENDQTTNNLIDTLMEETINENKIDVHIVLTKRQYNLWLKKGGEKWLKNKLV